MWSLLCRIVMKWYVEQNPMWLRVVYGLEKTTPSTGKTVPMAEVYGRHGHGR